MAKIASPYKAMFISYNGLIKRLWYTVCVVIVQINLSVLPLCTVML